jgi:hypothetical protein
MDAYRTSGRAVDPQQWLFTEKEWSSWREKSMGGNNEFYHPVVPDLGLEFTPIAPGPRRLVIRTLSVYFDVGSLVISRKSNYNITRFSA